MKIQKKKNKMLKLKATKTEPFTNMKRLNKRLKSERKIIPS